MSMRVLFGGGKGTAVKPLPGGGQVQKEATEERTSTPPKPFGLEEDVVQLAGSRERKIEVEPLQLDGGLHDKAVDAIAMLWVKQGELTEEIEATTDKAEQERLNEEYALRLVQIQKAEACLSIKQYDLAVMAAEADLEVVRSVAEKYSQQPTFVPEVPKVPTHGASSYRSVPVSQNPQLSEAEKRGAFAASRSGLAVDAPGLKPEKPKMSNAELNANLEATRADIKWYQHMSHIPEAREYLLVSSKKLEQLEDLRLSARSQEARALAGLDYWEYRAQHFDRNPMNLARVEEIRQGGIIHPAPSLEKWLPRQQQIELKSLQTQKQSPQSPPPEKQKLVAEA